MKQHCLMEFVGTLFLALAVGMGLAPLAVGLMLMAVVYIGWHISGAEYNPAVTVAMLCKKAVDPKEGLAAIACQIAGALVAVGLVCAFTGQGVGPISVPAMPLWAACLNEVVLTFLFVMVVATMASKYTSTDIHGVAIGLTFAAVKSLRGSINPAIALAGLIAHAARGGMMPDVVGPFMAIYVLSPLVGGAAAAHAYGWFNKKR